MGHARTPLLPLQTTVGSQAVESHLHRQRAQLREGGDAAHVEAGAGRHIQQLKVRHGARQPVGERLEQGVAAELEAAEVGQVGPGVRDGVHAKEEDAWQGRQRA